MIETELKAACTSSLRPLALVAYGRIHEELKGAYVCQGDLDGVDYLPP